MRLWIRTEGQNVLRLSLRYKAATAVLSLGLLFSEPCLAGPFGSLTERLLSEAISSPGVTSENYKGRELLVYVPPNMPGRGTRALVIVLHGVLGNASRIEGGASEKGLKMDEVARKNGFIVAYLNGTPVTRRLGPDKLGWNAGGGCCGVPAENNVDDVGYITNAVKHLVDKFGIDPSRVYGIGHSNGAMMTMRLMCKANIYAAAVSISGPLNLIVQNCPGARGKHILAIHGEDDQIVPITGGQGAKGLSRVSYKSEQYTQQIFAASGADFRLQTVSGADHFLDNIDARIEQTESVSIAQKVALFFGFLKTGPSLSCSDLLPHS
jgi:poly(3-hydroxybutyrate) depolymerase